MSILDDLKAVTEKYQDEYKQEKDPEERLWMAADAGGLALFIVSVLFFVAAVAWALFKFVLPGLVVAGVAWYFWAKKNDKLPSKIDFKKKP